MNWYFVALKKYAVFNGRSRRKEYWYFSLFGMLLLLSLSVVDFYIGTFDAEAGIGLLGGGYAIATLLPSLAVMVRRLHDTGRSGWWSLIFLIPLLGPIVIIIFLVQNSKPGENQYGPNPLELAP
ncbi:MAG: DUF805 domain-containing protein [Magnetococcales bacterium]|nr:DUF805 domain-containing protein [Magnetococcales bacterium]